MTLTYGAGRPEIISHSYMDRDGVQDSYNAVSDGRDRWTWNRRDETGEIIASGVITNSNRWEAEVRLVEQMMRDHDRDRQARSAPLRDRIVDVDQAGNLTAATIMPRR